MQKQRIILIAVAVGLGIIAVVMIKVWLDQQQKLIMEDAKNKLAQIQANSSPVLVAKAEIPRGSLINADVLETVIVPNKYVQPMAATSLDRLAGMIALAPFSKGEQVTMNKLAYPGHSGGSLAEITPVGKRAIVLSIDNIGALAGMIKVGDFVDIVAVLPIPVQTPDGKTTTQAAVMPLFQKVKVMAIGRQTTPIAAVEGSSRYKEEEKSSGSPLFTFTLSPQETNLLAFVQEQQAKIRLILRSPADDQVQPFQAASWDALFQYLIPVQPQKPQVKQEPKEYVEIYRGLNREKIPLVEK